MGQNESGPSDLIGTGGKPVVISQIGVSRSRHPSFHAFRNPEPRISDSAQDQAHGSGAWSQDNRPGGGVLMFVI
jgi:hypothetical protein